jgi:hypothetical protein
MRIFRSRRHDAHATEQQEAFQKLDQTLQDFISKLAQGITHIGDLIAIENVETRGLMRTQHAESKNFIQSEHAKTTHTILSGLQKLQIQTADDADCQRLLASLYFSQFDARREEVRDAHLQTFEWIFDNSGQAVYPWYNFVEWLKGKSSLYWVNGKAGSGKSTLMNFICTDERTKTHLLQWRSEDPIILTFFFWNAGSTLQKSSSGLLRSLLYQLLRHDERLVPTILAMVPDQTLKDANAAWSTRQLGRIFTQAIDLATRPICIFLDGLDEFDEDEDYLIHMITSLSVKPDLKLCVSSRPSHNLNSAFRGCPWLRLQDLTRKDMEIYVDDFLLKSPKVAYLSQQDGQGASELAESVVEKAQGVFLWVRLVVNILLRGLGNQDSWIELQKRLDILPSDIEKLYSHMWSRLNEDREIYREQAALWFRTILFGELSLLEFMIASNPDLHTKIFDPQTWPPLSVIAAKCEMTKVHISTRCAGLLEVDDIHNLDAIHPPDSPPQVDDLTLSSASSTKEPPSPREIHSTNRPPGPRELRKYKSTIVRFIHRSARDFLVETVDGKNILGAETMPNIDIYASILQAKLATVSLRFQYLSDHWLVMLLDGVAKHQDTLKLSSDKAKSDLLDIIQAGCEQLVSRNAKLGDPQQWYPRLMGDSNNDHVATDFLGRTVAFSISPLMSKWARNKMANADISYRSYLLLCAVHHCWLPAHLNCIMILLQNGADPNARHCFGREGELQTEISAWNLFLGRWSSDPMPWQISPEELTKTFHYFLDHGASVNELILISNLGGGYYDESKLVAFHALEIPINSECVFISMNVSLLLDRFTTCNSCGWDDLRTKIKPESSKSFDTAVVVRGADGNWSRVEHEEDIAPKLINDRFRGFPNGDTNLVLKQYISEIQGRLVPVEFEGALKCLGWDRARPEYVRKSFLNHFEGKLKTYVRSESSETVSIDD